MRGHGDTVRGLALMPGVGFLSASHDCTARLWTHGGDSAAVFAGHTALVYSVAALANGGVVTGSEDNTARVWRASDGQCLQTIAHPGCVWSVGAFAECGDVVTCCADGVARVWTQDAGKADPAAAAAMQAAMVAAKEERDRTNLAQQQSNIKTEDPTALQLPGASDGATKVIREEGGTIAAYAWSAGTASWERLGEVTGRGGVGVGVGSLLTIIRLFFYSLFGSFSLGYQLDPSFDDANVYHHHHHHHHHNHQYFLMVHMVKYTAVHNHANKIKD